MSRGTNAPRTRRLAAFTAAAGLALAAVLASAVPASAHDELLLSDPAAGTTLQALPAEVTLTFSAFPLDEPGATLVEVTDAAGTDLTSGDPVLDDTDVTQALEGTATGVITVLWKIVSSDGHPLDGEFSFTVAGGGASPTATTTPEPTDTAEPTSDATTDATTDPTATETPAPDSVDDDTSPAVLWTIAGVIVAAVIAVVAYLLISRSRRRRDLQNARQGSRADGDRPVDED